MKHDKHIEEKERERKKKRERERKKEGVRVKVQLLLPSEWMMERASFWRVPSLRKRNKEKEEARERWKEKKREKTKEKREAENQKFALHSILIHYVVTFAPLPSSSLFLSPFFLQKNFSLKRKKRKKENSRGEKGRKGKKEKKWKVK